MADRGDVLADGHILMDWSLLAEPPETKSKTTNVGSHTFETRPMSCLARHAEVAICREYAAARVL